MPARYRIYSNVAFVYTEAYGRLCGEDIVAHGAALAADPAFSPTYAQLIDLRAVTEFATGAEEMRRSARSNPFNANARRVALVGTPVAYGLMRMYQLLTDTEDSGTLVTRDEAEAWAHVGRGPDTLLQRAPSTWFSSADRVAE